MALCSSCFFFDEEYDDFRKQYDDVVKEKKEPEKHYCPMYYDHIPHDIYHKNADCDYYEKRDADG